ncbi:MAG: nuclear transport factor 2 family protein [Pseudomonadota bacterium]
MERQKMQATIKRWHAMVASRDLGALHEIIHPDAMFRSPVAHTPYQGRDALTLALSTVINVFEDFTYHREFFTDDAKNATLEFSAHVGGKQLKGVDLIKFNDDGLIIEFEVMIRPASGLMALGEEMGKRVGADLVKHKGS